MYHFNEILTNLNMNKPSCGVRSVCFCPKKANFGQTRVLLIKQKRHIFTLRKTSIHAKNQGNPMCGFLEKLTWQTDRQTDRERETRQYLMVRIARWASDQKANFREVFFTKMAKTVKIIKKALGTFFSHLQALTNCKVPEKSNEHISRKTVTPEWTRAKFGVLTN